MSIGNAIAEYGGNGPDLGPIFRIHRHKGLVYFAPGGAWKGTAISVSDLETWFPAMREELMRNWYYTLQGFTEGSKTRNAESVAYLTTCWVDIDSKPDKKTGAPALHDADFGIATIERAVTLGLLPEQSITVKSGVGCWAMWLLEGQPGEAETVPKYSPRKELQRAINYRIGSILLDLAPGLQVDRKTSGPQYARVPGSINPNTNQPVSYRFHHNVSDRPGGLVYTLDELAERLNLAQPVEEERQPKPHHLRLVRPYEEGPEEEPTFPEPKAPQVIKPRITHKKRLDELHRLIVHRGIIREGGRHDFILTMARVYRHAGLFPGETWCKVSDLNRRYCNPPLDSRDIKAQIHSVFGPGADRKVGPKKDLRAYYISNVRLAGPDYFNVTAEEIDYLGLESIRADYKNARHAPKKNQRPKKAARLEFIRGLDLAGHHAWTRESLAAKVRAAGHKCSEATISNDLAELGVQSPESRMRVEYQKLKKAIVPLIP